MKTLTHTDLRLVISRLPKDVQKLMNSNSELILAGGFIRSTISGEKPSDIDLFGPTIDFQKRMAATLTTERKGRMHETPNAITVLSPPRMPIQFITRWTFGAFSDCIQSFDFTVCKAAICKLGNIWTSCIDDNFYADLAARRLVYTFPTREESPGGSMMRVIKFLKRGYNIQPESLAGVITRILTAIEGDVHKIDTWKIVAGLLREVDPLQIIDGIDLIEENLAEYETLGILFGENTNP